MHSKNHELQNKNPGHINGANQITDRDQVSTSGNTILPRTIRNRPDSEDEIRGIYQQLSLRTGRTPAQIEKIIMRTPKLVQEFAAVGVIIA